MFGLMKPNKIIFVVVVFLIVSCNVVFSNKRMFNFIINNNTINISYFDILKIKYNKSTTPLEICMREELANKAQLGKVHIEHTMIKEYWREGLSDAIFTLVNGDTIGYEELDETQLSSFVEGFFRKLNGELLSNEELDEVLKDTLKVQFDIIRLSSKQVDIIFNGNKKFQLKKRNNQWKLFGIKIKTVKFSPGYEDVEEVWK